MNDKRRKLLKIISNKINKHIEQINLLREDLDYVLSDEQDAFDNLPESLQNGERGNDMQECIDKMESAISEFETCVESLESINESIEEIRGIES